MRRGLSGRDRATAIAVCCAISLQTTWAFGEDASSACRRLAASPHEPGIASGEGVPLAGIDVVRARAACNASLEDSHGTDPVAAFRLSRTYMASGPGQDVNAALWLQRKVWAGGKRWGDRLGEEAAAWYAQAGQANLTPGTYLSAAEAGDPVAQVMLAYVLAVERLNATGSPPDFDAALKWMGRSADQGHLPGITGVGALFWMQEQYDGAIPYYQKAADMGDRAGQVSLAYAYMSGQGVARSDTFALRYFVPAAEGGNTFAQKMIGNLFYRGIDGAPPNMEMARHWYKRAADLGDQEAVNMLAKAQDTTEIDGATALAILAALGVLVLMSGGEGRSDTASPEENSTDWLAEQDRVNREALASACSWAQAGGDSYAPFC